MSSPHDCPIAPQLRRQSRYPPPRRELGGESAGTPASATAAPASDLAPSPGTRAADNSTPAVSATSPHSPRSASNRIAPAAEPGSSPASRGQTRSGTAADSCLARYDTATASGRPGSSSADPSEP